MKFKNGDIVWTATYRNKIIQVEIDKDLIGEWADVMYDGELYGVPLFKLFETKQQAIDYFGS